MDQIMAAVMEQFKPPPSGFDNGLVFEKTRPPAINDEPVMYILVNGDLNMSPGKVAAQVGHVVQIIIKDLERALHIKDPESAEIINKYLAWESAPTKIILTSTTQDMETIIATDPECKYFYDTLRDHVQVHNDFKYLTVIGFYPGNKTRRHMQKYKLY